MNTIIKQEHEHYFLNLKGRAANVVADSETGRILNQGIYVAGAFRENGRKKRISVELRFDDNYNNGHESFGITANIYEGRLHESGGCQHEVIIKHFPELAPFIKWHLTSTGGPMHYIANTVYHVERRELDYARVSAVWPEATDEQLTMPGKSRLEAALQARRPGLMAEFRKDMLKIGFIWPEHK